MQYSDDEPARAEEAEYEGFELKRYLDMWSEAVDDYTEPRRQHYRDEEYYDGDVKGTGWGQWTETELTTLMGRKQPPTTRNLIERKVNAVAGVEQRARSEPRALPRTPKDQYSAEIATDCLRYIKEKTRWEYRKADLFIEALKVGFAAVEIGGSEDNVPLTPIEWKEFFFDPRSRRPDFSDARYLGVAKWLDKDVAIATYVPPKPEPPAPLPPPQLPPQPADPMLAQQWAAIAQQAIEQYQAQVAVQEAEYNRALQKRDAILQIIESTASGEGSTGPLNADQFEDRPSNSFCDQKRRRIFVIDMWHRDAKHGWYRCVFTGGGKLFTQEATLEETDDWGRKVKTHPIQAFSLFVSRDLWRYGLVRGMRSPQDEVNFRLSKMLHWLMTNQLWHEEGVFPDGQEEAARAEVQKPDGKIKVRPGALSSGAVKVDRGLDMVQALSAAGEDARQFLEMGGPNPQLQGEQGRATSGRAVLALQQAGLGQLGPIFDRLYEWELRVYRAMWARVQQFWTAPMYVRVTDDKNAAKFAAVNGAQILDERGQPKRKQQMMVQPDGSDMPGRAPMMPPQGGPEPGAMLAPMLGHNGGPPIDPSEFETGPMLAELDMDIIIDRAPEAATLQAEQFEELARLAGTGLFNTVPPLEVARLMIQASALPNKSELLDKIDQIEQQQSKNQQPNPAQMAQLKELIAKVEKLQAEKDKIRAETAKIAGADIPKTQAETARTVAQARTENVTARMNEFGATRQLEMDAFLSAQGLSAPNTIDPLAAAASGDLGLPPIQG